MNKGLLVQTFARCLSTCRVLHKVPRVLPVAHQVSADHNRQYLTPYPQLTREELEEPPPRVSEEVAELLRLRRKKILPNDKWIPPRIEAWKYRHRRREFIAAGHYFPVMPMRDRMLDGMPKVRKSVLKSEERQRKIEENMKMMPQWIAEYKETIRKKREQRHLQDAKQQALASQMSKLGLNPKDPRAKEIVANINSGKSDSAEKTVKKKKKFTGKSKKAAAV